MSLTLEEIARALGGDVSGAEVLAPGPGHSAKDRSLSVRLSDKAKDGFVVFSFSGGTWQEGAAYVRGRLGLPPWEPSKKRANGQAKPREIRRTNYSILWPDSDDLGEKYIAKAAAAIRDEDPKADIRVVRPLGVPNGAKGKDICDWQGDAEALARLAAEAVPYRSVCPGRHRTAKDKLQCSS